MNIHILVSYSRDGYEFLDNLIRVPNQMVDQLLVKMRYASIRCFTRKPGKKRTRQALQKEFS